MFSLDLSVVGLASPAPAGGRTDSTDRALCIPVSRDRPRVCLSFLLIHQEEDVRRNTRSQSVKAGAMKQ